MFWGLEFWKDGKQVQLAAVRMNGHVGQVLIFDGVSYGDRSTPSEKYPLAGYQQPAIFTIVEKIEGENAHYVVTDAENRRIVLPSGFHDPSTYMYDLKEWLAFQESRISEKLARKEAKIALLEAHLALLKSILTNQGVRVVSAEQAKKLGIE